MLYSQQPLQKGSVYRRPHSRLPPDIVPCTYPPMKHSISTFVTHELVEGIQVIMQGLTGDEMIVFYAQCRSFVNQVEIYYS